MHMTLQDPTRVAANDAASPRSPAPVSGCTPGPATDMPKLMELARRRQAWNEAHPGAHPDEAIDAWHAMAEELGL